MDCNSLAIWDVATDLLEYLYGQLEGSLFGRPCQTLVSLCEPIIPCCDYLAVYVEELPGQPLVQDCSSIIGEENVTFKVKLVRPFNTANPCSPTLEDVRSMRMLFADMSVLRAALIRWGSRGLGGDTFTEFEVFPVNSVCDEREMCSGILSGISISMNVCDDGECEPFYSRPARCDCDQVFVDEPGVNPDEVLSYE